jgi:phage-related holin
MWNAHEWRYIDSTALRDGFWSKTIVYFILIIVAFVGDTILGINHIPKFCLVIFCGVLVCTELLSILENLGECGVSSVQDLKELIKKRKEGLK